MSWTSIGLLANWMRAAGITPEEQLPFSQVVLLFLLLFGPPTLGYALGAHFRREVNRSRMPWATYWTILSGLTAALFAFLGITSIEELMGMLRTLGWLS